MINMPSQTRRERYIIDSNEISFRLLPTVVFDLPGPRDCDPGIVISV
jgi:hypothetical protein